MDEQDDTAGGLPFNSVGARLKAAREAQGLELGQVAQRTRIPTRHLAQIERGEHAGLPAPTYSVGFVKTYATMLGLNAQSLSQQFRGELSRIESPSPRQEPYEPADPARIPGRGLAWAAAGLAVILVLVFLYWRGTQAGENPVTLAAQGPQAPAPALVPPPAASAPAGVTAAPSPPAVAGATLLTATQPVWIKVYEMGGSTLFMGMLQPGDHYQVPADATDPRLLTGRPNALDVTVGGTAIPALGPPEHLVKDVPLKPAALLARAAPSVPTPAAAAPVPVPQDAPVPVQNSAAPE